MVLLLSAPGHLYRSSSRQQHHTLAFPALLGMFMFIYHWTTSYAANDWEYSEGVADVQCRRLDLRLVTVFEQLSIA